ncbi:hypothetical protein [Alteromonas oceanisediminis]|uniref:hypothetical protein n=1 Tax=Alteromonas oceanisediminis TaxID=2836180 RepID=UPI001BD9F67F|nr:hypothetical protein [Alteromonas oceanisediminis]MBT0586973.1 hypothetical protein [Alteromonas oceanisediminis]
MQESIGKTTTAEFLCPDCGAINTISTQLLGEKYRDHEMKCCQCNHLLEVVVADGLRDSVNIIASSVEENTAGR